MFVVIEHLHFLYFLIGYVLFIFCDVIVKLFPHSVYLFLCINYKCNNIFLI